MLVHWVKVIWGKDGESGTPWGNNFFRTKFHQSKTYDTWSYGVNPRVRCASGNIFLIFYSLCWAEVQFLGDNCAIAEGYGAWVGKMEVAKRLLSTALLISGQANSGNMEWTSSAWLKRLPGQEQQQCGSDIWRCRTQWELGPRWRWIVIMTYR